MPVPLLLVAAAGVVSSSTVAGTTSVVGGGVVAGSFFANIASIWFFFFRKKAPKPSLAHEASLKKQAMITQERKNEVSDATASMGDDTGQLVSSLRKTASEISSASEVNNKSTGKLLKSSSKVQGAAHAVEHSSQVLLSALPLLMEISKKTCSQTDHTIARMSKLNKALLDTKPDIAQTNTEIQKVTVTIGAQAASLDQLTSALEAITVENSQLKKRIQGQASTQDKHLEPVDQRIDDSNPRLFKPLMNTPVVADASKASIQAVSL
jgi:septal ring factor EnvC (AmiA/AmiB activator)